MPTTGPGGGGEVPTTGSGDEERCLRLEVMEGRMQRREVKERKESWREWRGKEGDREDGMKIRHNNRSHFSTI